MTHHASDPPSNYLLRGIQLDLRPDSVWLTPQEMLERVGHSYAVHFIYYLSHYPNGQFYHAGNEKFLGFRYGVEPEDYISF